ncbi:MAG TPA: hypothetical protein VEA59_03805 [Patescibacteria group bacterium]|nr:hypothetical protein [Patescibacteria group bacterium]
MKSKILMVLGVVLVIAGIVVLYGKRTPPQPQKEMTLVFLPNLSSSVVVNLLPSDIEGEVRIEPYDVRRSAFETRWHEMIPATTRGCASDECRLIPSPAIAEHFPIHLTTSLRNKSLSKLWIPTTWGRHRLSELRVPNLQFEEGIPYAIVIKHPGVEVQFILITYLIKRNGDRYFCAIV